MTDNLLNVWYRNDLVGKLWQSDTGKIGFRYEGRWLNNGFAISQMLPLQQMDYLPEQGIAHQFFTNLLPEANARNHIIRNLKIQDNDFDLLKAIGGECAGALSILPMDYLANTEKHYQPLTTEKLQNLLLTKGNVLNFGITPRPRLSLAGAQDKCPIFFDEENYFLPQDAAPSTHILKFEITDYRNIPAYEYFMNQLAASIGLPVVQTQLKKLDKEYFLVIKRYDRIIDAKQNIQRLHQEDFCQALGVGYQKKYQQNGGPSFKDCYNLILQISSQPVDDAENLLKWQMFNWLAGNSDGHAKNLAILYDYQQHIRLAPFYDLVCTRAIEHLDPNLALSIGGEFNPSRITNKHWVQLAVDCHIRETYVQTLVNEMAENLLAKFSIVQQQFENTIGLYPALQRVHQVVTKQCHRALRD